MAPQKLENDLILGSRVKGSAVYNTAGEHIGHVEDFSIEKVSGQVRYALLSCGGFLGLADKLHPLPWSVLDYDTAKSAYIVPLDKDALKGAPSYTVEELQNFGGKDLSYRDAIYSYYATYGTAPYW